MNNDAVYINFCSCFLKVNSITKLHTARMKCFEFYCTFETIEKQRVGTPTQNKALFCANANTTKVPISNPTTTSQRIGLVCNLCIAHPKRKSHVRRRSRPPCYFHRISISMTSLQCGVSFSFSIAKSRCPWRHVLKGGQPYLEFLLYGIEEEEIRLGCDLFRINHHFIIFYTRTCLVKRNLGVLIFVISQFNECLKTNQNKLFNNACN